MIGKLKLLLVVLFGQFVTAGFGGEGVFVPMKPKAITPELAVKLEVKSEWGLEPGKFVLLVHVKNNTVRPVTLCVLDNWVPVIQLPNGVTAFGGLERDTRRPVNKDDFPIIGPGAEHVIKFYALARKSSDGSLEIQMNDRFGGTWRLPSTKEEKVAICMFPKDVRSAPAFDLEDPPVQLKERDLNLQAAPSNWVVLSFEKDEKLVGVDRRGKP